MDIFSNIFLPLLKYFIAPLLVGLILLVISKKKFKNFFKINRKQNKINENVKDNTEVSNKNVTTLILGSIFIGISIAVLVFTIINFATDTKLYNSKIEKIVLEEYKETGRGNTDSPVNAIFVREDYAYLACEDGLQIFEIKNNTPKFISSLNVEGNSVDVVIDDIYAYVLSDLEVSYDGILSIINISDKKNPELISSYRIINEEKDIFNNSNNGLFVFKTPIFKKLAIKNNNAFIVDCRGLKIFDISDKKTISLISSCDTFYEAVSLYVYNNYVFIADGVDGIQIVEIKNALKPRIVGLYETDGEASDVYVKDEIAYIADGIGGLVVLEIGNKIGINYNQMNFNGYIKVDQFYSNQVCVEDNYVYISTYHGINIINVDQENIFSPDNHKSFGEYKTKHNIEDIFVNKGVIYTAESGSGFAIISKNQ